MRVREPGSFQDVLMAIAEDVTWLARKQVMLFQAEVGEAVRRVVLAVVFFVLGVTSAVVALVFCGIALFEWLVVVLNSRLLAAATVAGSAAFLAILLALIAWYRLSRTNFVPRRTLASLHATARDLFGGRDDE